MRDLLRQIQNHGRPLYWRMRFALLNGRWVRTYTLARKLAERLANVACSVCQSTEICRITFFIDHRVDKCYCKQCHHIFSNKLNHDPVKASQLFSYDRPNEQYRGQRQLQSELIRSAAVTHGTYLDFGVGGNIGIADDLKQRYPEHDFFACDLYSLHRPNYFQIYSREAPLRRFDGISSNAVIEHLDNTVEAWRYFNNLLKPMREGGGWMVHAFPSQLVEDLDHWAIRIESHECLFSRTSLSMICEQSGFGLLTIKYLPEVQHPVYYFRKVRDCK